MSKLEPQRYKLTVAYDGSAYAGWQIQPNAMTVQEALQTALKSLVMHAVQIHGSGRTDAGVHANGQVVHFDLVKDFAPDSLRRALNAVLPADIRILASAYAAPDFHARKSAVAKTYVYQIWNARVLLPTRRLYFAHVKRELNLAAMSEAASYLIGKHDFAAFSANPSRRVETTVRTISRLDITRDGEAIMFWVRGDGFLYKMVRSISGWLIRVGQGECLPERTLSILEASTRTAEVPTAAPQGLFLDNVEYG